jgi:hypothetical protein
VTSAGKKKKGVSLAANIIQIIDVGSRILACLDQYAGNKRSSLRCFAISRKFCLSSRKRYGT